MRSLGKSTAAVAVGTALLFIASGRVDAKPAYSKDEKKPCSFCHVGKTNDKVFTDAGTYYGTHHTRKGFAEQAKAPATPAKTADKPAAVPAESVAAAAGMEDKQDAGGTEKTGYTGCCGCPCCNKCGHMHGMGEMPPMMEKMKGHLEEMKKAVASLRESEKAVEGAGDVETLRNGVLSHLKKLDDLQEAHLKHMESMMAARHGGKAGPPHRHCW